MKLRSFNVKYTPPVSKSTQINFKLGWNNVKQNVTLQTWTEHVLFIIYRSANICALQSARFIRQSGRHLELHSTQQGRCFHKQGDLQICSSEWGKIGLVSTNCLQNQEELAELHYVYVVLFMPNRICTTTR